MTIGKYGLLAVMFILHVQSSCVYSEEINASVDWAKFQKLEGADNQGAATLAYDHKGTRVSGAIATPFALGRTDASLSSTVRFKLPEPGAVPQWASAAIAIYGKDRAKRLYSMVIFGAPAMAAGTCEIGFYHQAMIRRPLAFDQWQTMKVEAADGLVRMKVWSDGTEEPDWMAEEELSGFITEIDAIGVRTYGMPVPFDAFNASGASSDEPARTFEVAGKGWRAVLDRFGRIRSYDAHVDGEMQSVLFRLDKYAGPAWFGQWGGAEKRLRLRPVKPADDKPVFAAIHDGIRFGIEYRNDNDRLVLIATAANTTDEPWTPKAAGIRLGLDTYMQKYPDWNDTFFPTLIRGEKTHLWGYFMSPKGRILTISSPDPIASWNYEYQPRRHRIYTVSLDLLHTLPLPERHPQNLTQLLPGQEKSWTIFLEEVDDLKEVKPIVSKTINAPMFDMDRYTVAEGESSEITIYTDEEISLSVTDPQGKVGRLNTGARQNDQCTIVFTPDSGVGTYTFKAKNESGRVSEAMLYLRQPWSWYLKQARKEAIRCPQKAAGCCENWLGHFSTMLAKRYFPDETLDARAEANFRTILPLMYDLESGHQIAMPFRIQNSYYMFSLLTDVYRATGSIEDLELASKVADWLIKHQSPDGAYRNGRTHYTCVAYGVKSMLELAAAEKELANTSDVWRERHRRHFQSAKAAINELERNLDNIQTEGQMTYEDGMISCSATQLAMWAVCVHDDREIARFRKAADYMFKGHRCLDQMIVPDCRYHEGTLRFWEAQYDVLIPRNMMNSPHGWTAWRIPGYYYMYLLTGEEEWLRRAMNSLGSCVQLIDGESGRLRHCFAQDPFVNTSVFKRNSESGHGGVYVSEVIGEQYIEMISDFHKPKDLNKLLFAYSKEDGSSCDNDVHEIFKALEEVALTSAYLIERADGSLITYNCKAEKVEGTVHIIPAEEVVSRVHLNLKTKHKVQVKFGSGETVSGSYFAMQWIGPGGVPEDLRID